MRGMGEGGGLALEFSPEFVSLAQESPCALGFTRIRGLFALDHEAAQISLHPVDYGQIPALFQEVGDEGMERWHVPSVAIRVPVDAIATV